MPQETGLGWGTQESLCPESPWVTSSHSMSSSGPQETLFQFSLQGCDTCHELCVPPVHCTPVLVPVWGHGPEWLLGEDRVPPLQGHCRGHGRRIHCPCSSPSSRTLQKAPGLHQEPEGRAGSVGTNRAPVGSAHCVTMRSWHSSAPTPFSFSLLLLCAQSRGQAWGQQWEARTPQHLAGEPCACSAPCPRTSPPHLLGRVPCSGRAGGSTPWQRVPGCSAGASQALASCPGGDGSS